jgi:hypothetical protein
MRKSIGIVLGALVGMTGWFADCERSAVAGGGPGADHGRGDGDDDDGGIGHVRCPFDVPAALNPPADATLEAAFAARGVQIYTCAVPAAGGAPAWTLKAPHAVLFKGFDTAAIHFAGPSWQANDGSLVTGTRTASDPGPDPTAIAWLLLQASSNVGPGLFADTTWIQRLDTEGGVAPATGCDAGHVGAQVLVPYRANYFFYHAATPGQKVRQCAAH